MKKTGDNLQRCIEIEGESVRFVGDLGFSVREFIQHPDIERPKERLGKAVAAELNRD